MPQTEEQLFVITASNADAQRHIGKSIANSIDPALYTQHFDSAVLEDVKQKSADGKFYAWGAVPGERNQPNWSSMQAGDYVLVYQAKHYTYWTRVISKRRNAARLRPDSCKTITWSRHSRRIDPISRSA